MSLWDRVKSGVSQAAEEAQRQASRAKLTLDLNGVRGDIRDKTMALGAAALDQARQGKVRNPTLTGIVAEIEALEARAKELEAQIDGADDDKASKN